MPQEDNLDTTRGRVLANARAIYGSTRSLDVVTFGTTSSLQITAAVIEHNPAGRAYIHCCSAAEDSRLAAVEHLLIITEDLLARLMEGISSSGWLPVTPQSQHASVFGSMPNLLQFDTSRRGSGIQGDSRRGSAIPSGSGGGGGGGGREIVNGPGRIEGTIASSASSAMASPHPSSVSMAATTTGGSTVMAVPRPQRMDRVQWIMGSEG